MRIMRQAFVALSVAACLVLTPREVSAAPYQLCLAIPGGDLFLNFIVQGQGIVVTGFSGTLPVDLHGPVFGSLAKGPNNQGVKMGLTVTYANEGDELYRTERRLVITFSSTPGQVHVKSWESGEQPTTGTGYIYACPAS